MAVQTTKLETCDIIDIINNIITNIFVYIIYILPLNIFKNVQNNEIYCATWVKN